jgi:predicted transposase YbfD/YdcC
MHEETTSIAANDAALETVTEAAAVENAVAHTPRSQPEPSAANGPKHTRAVAKVEQAKTAIASIDEEVEACVQKVREELERYRQKQARFVEETLKPLRSRLRTLGADEVEIAAAPEPKVDLENPDIAPVEIVKLSSGKAGGLLYGLLAGVAGVGAWCYTATQALGLPLIPEKIPDFERVKTLFGWTAQQLGQGENPVVGGTLVGVGFVGIVALVYWIVTALRGSSNLKTAEKIEADTEFYCTQKGECKTQMEKVREHIARAGELIETYDILLAEQNARLRRAIHFEAVEHFDQLHERTQEDVKQAKRLATYVERFMETPMAEHGILSQEGIAIFDEAKEVADAYVVALYR